MRLPPDVPWTALDPRSIANGPGGTVWEVTLSEGGKAALKLASTAAIEEQRRASDYLRWRAGMGAVRLIRQDRPWSLLEWAGDETLADRLDALGDDGATQVLGHSIRQLHAPGGGVMPARFLPLAAQFSCLFETAKLAAGPAYREGAVLAARMLVCSQDAVPLHGDLHHGNLVHGERGWLAIDPKGLVGDAAYDAANVFLNPAHAAADWLIERIPARMRMLSSILDCPARHLLQWALAHSSLSAAWHRQDGEKAAEVRALQVCAAIRRIAEGSGYAG